MEGLENNNIFNRCKCFFSISNSFIIGYFKCLILSIKKSLILNYMFSKNGFVFQINTSVICNYVISLINKLIYNSNKKIFNGSMFVRHSDSLSFSFLCLFILSLLTMHQTLWNNKYIFVGIAFLCLFYILSLINNNNKFSLVGIDSYLILFSIICVFSSFCSINFIISVRYLLFLIACILFVFLIRNIIKDKKRLEILIYVISLGLLISSVYAFVQYCNGILPDKFMTDLSMNSSVPGRVYSFFQNPNSFALILILFLPILFSMFLIEKRSINKLYLFVVIIIALLALLFTFSRGAWLAFFASFCVMLFFINWKYFILFILLCFIALPFLPSFVIERLLSLVTGDSSIFMRYDLYSSTLSYIYSNLLCGSGFGNSILQFMIYSGGYYFTSIPLYVHSHSLYLQICAESGIFALVFYGLNILWLLVNGIKLIIKNRFSKYNKFLGVGLFSGYVGFLIFSLFDYPWVFPRVMIINWLLIGLLYVIINLNDKEERSDLCEKKDR